MYDLLVNICLVNGFGAWRMGYEGLKRASIALRRHVGMCDLSFLKLRVLRLRK